MQRGGWRDLIRARMARMGGGPSRSSAPSRRPSNNGRDVEMQVRNQRAGMAAGGPVPGLPGLHFASDLASGMATAAKSSADFHSGDLNKMMNHPAVGWSKSMAGIDGLAGSEIGRITGETESRLADKGIARDSTGTWRLGQNQQQVTGASLSTQAAKSPLTGTPAGSTTPFSKIADTVKSAVGGGPQPQSTGGLTSGIRDVVNQALATSRIPAQTGVRPIAPTNPSVSRPIAPPTSTPAAAPASQGGGGTTAGLPVIQSPSRLPGSAVSGLDANGQPVQPPASTITPGTNVQGQPVTLQPAPTAVGTTPTAGGQPAPVAGPAGPTGTVPVGDGSLVLPNAQGMSWDTLAPYEATIQAEAAKWGVDPRILRSVIALESQGNVDAQNPNSSSHGLLQIQPEWHAQGAAQLGYTLGTPEGDIGYFAALIAGQAPGQNLTGDPLSNAVEIMAGGTAGGSADYAAAYRHDIEALMGMQGEPAALPPAGGQGQVDPATGQPVLVGTTNSPGQPVQVGTTNPVDAQTANITTPPAPGADQTAPVGPTGAGGLRGPVVSGNVAPTQATDGMGQMATPDSDESWIQTAFPNGATISTEYKQPVTWEVPALGDCPYCYQDGHGADGTTHAAMDIAGNYGDPVATPVAGTVVCSGGGEGPGVPGFNCSYAIGPTFEDNNGPGQITLDVGTDAAGNQLLINTIHMGGSVVTPGQQLNPGDQIGTMGSMGGMVHTHIEGLAICNGNYIYVDPTLVYNGYYNSHSACEGY